MTGWVPDPELVERWAKHRLEVNVGDGYVGFRVTTAQDRWEMDNAMAGWERRWGHLLDGTEYAIRKETNDG